MSLRAVTTDDEDSGPFDEVTEECDGCERETTHTVTVELRQENPDSTFSTEPYRVSECTVCGSETTRRMNNE